MKHYTMLPRGVSLLAVLALCVLYASGQTSLQFWFDSDKTIRQADLPASGTLKGKIDMQFLSQGFHTMFMRVKQTGIQYEYSPITMSTFIKFATGEGAKLQYWFDDDADNFSTIDVDAESGKEQTLMLDLSNIERFPLGVHQLNIRVAHNGGHYSPIYSAYTLRLPVSSDNSVLQYWFDDDVDNPSTINVSTESSDPQILTLDLSNIERFPLGVHQLNMRVAQNSVNFSPVYSAYVLRLPAGTGNSMLEYWFDEDYENHASIPVLTDKDGIQKLDLDLSDMTKFPYGFHRLNMRIASLGSQYSPVYSANVMRLRGGPNNYLTYWLDEDYANRRHTWSTTGNGKDAYFKVHLDFSTASAGMHRLHYRIASQDMDDGPVYEEPILVTRKYNNTTDVTIVNQSYWLDDVRTVIKAISNPKDVVSQTYTLIPENYSVGQHAFYVQYQNSVDVWSEENVTYFYKEAATGRLRAGHMPDQDTGIDDTTQSEDVICSYSNGTIYVDCQSPRLGKTGVIMVCDMTGRVVAQQNVTNADGIHAAVNVESLSRQLLIVKLVSGDVRYSKKVMKR